MRLRRRDWVILGLALAVILISFSYALKIGVGLSRAGADETKPHKKNTLVISVCSLQRGLLSAYGHQGPEIMPNLERFFRESHLVFGNMFNGMPWISFIAFFEKYYPELMERGNISPGPFTDFSYLRIPEVKSTSRFEFRDTNDSEWEKDYKDRFNWIKSALPLYGNDPFTFVVHIKYMHYPLIDYFNADSEWDYFLTQSEKAQIKEYLAHPEKYYEKLPFLLMLTADPIYAHAHPAVKAEGIGKGTPGSQKVLGLITSERFLQEWKRSDGYDGDLEILKKVYRGNARYMDAKITGPLADLFGNKKLKDNTNVIFTGDHGETHMDRDYLTHAGSPFDEGLVIPAAAYIPGAKKQIRVNEQMHIHSLADFTHDLTVGKFESDKAHKKIADYFEDVFIMRNCPNTLHAVRYKNKYKYIIEAGSGSRRLFDLEADPGELKDIANENPEALAKMEGLYWANLTRFKAYYPYRCEAWDQGGPTDVSF